MNIDITFYLFYFPEFDFDERCYKEEKTAARIRETAIASWPASVW